MQRRHRKKTENRQKTHPCDDVRCMGYLWFGSIGNVRFLLRRLPFELSLWQALLKFKWTGRPQRQTLLKLLHAVLDDDMVVRINVASVLKLGCPIAAQKNGVRKGFSQENSWELHLQGGHRFARKRKVGNLDIFIPLVRQDVHFVSTFKLKYL